MAHLHLHTNHSIIDGRGLIEDYLQLAKSDGQEAIAVTDHGTLGGIINSYDACKTAGIKLIAGMELYVDVAELRERNYPGHLTVLAKNESGYRALIAANNLAHRQFYYRPRITIQQIIEHNFAKDWVVLSGCMSSPIFDYPQSEAINIIQNLSRASGNFFLEFMWHTSKDTQYQAKREEYLERIGNFHKVTGIPMVITNDCHYALEANEIIHQDLLNHSVEPNELEFDGFGFHFKTSAQMEDLARKLGAPDGWDNAVEISKLCDLHIPEADEVKWYVPDITGGYPAGKIIRLCEAVLSARELPEEYWERYRFEFSVLETSPAILNSYLVAYDIIAWCVERNIPAAARGSMAGSLISWLLGITEEDPIKYRLSFSRAVNPARPTIPDFDLDVSSIHRPEILEYLRERYENNIPICSYQHYGPKGSLRKITKMEGKLSFLEVSELCKPLPDDWADGNFLYSPRDKKYIGQDPWTDSVPVEYHSPMAVYKGLYSSMSAHPCGILVAGKERELEYEVPMQWIASSKQLVSAYDMYTLKKIGLFKLDVLGLRTLDQLNCMQKTSGERIPNDDYNEPEVLAAFGADLLAEIFQMDGNACREVIRQIDGINTFEDIIAANTLARPGCAQFTPEYRTGSVRLIQEYPQLDDVLGVTNGLILYQEQVMEIARILADFDDAEQDDIKESIKYFRREHWVSSIEPKFRERCAAKNINPDNILEAISKMASYTYNRAHAMTYAAIAYKMMWYKIHHPVAYYSAVYDGAGDKQRLILESQFLGVHWHQPDINISEYETTIKDGEILLGLGSIKGVGPAAFEAIKAARPFISLTDLKDRVERRKCNTRVIDRLRESFACTSLGANGSIVVFREAFGFSYKFLDFRLAHEVELSLRKGRFAGFISDIREITISKPGPNNGKKMAHVSIINSRGKRRCTIFANIWHKARGKLHVGEPVVFDGYLDNDRNLIVEGGGLIE